MSASAYDPVGHTAFGIVLGKALSIPAAPFLLPQLLEALDNPDSGAARLEELICMDPGIAGATLRLANSSWFGLRRTCDTIGEAIFRLGLREIFRVAATTASVRWIATETSGYGWEPGDFCRHSVCVAVAARLIADATGLIDPSKAYCLGLLHDIGKLAIAHAIPEELARVHAQQIQSGQNWRIVEQEVLGFDHTQVSAALLDKWNFPQAMVVASKYYPIPSTAEVEFHPILAVLHSAKHLAISLGLGVGEEGFLTELDGEFLRAWNIKPGMCDVVLPMLAEEVKKILGVRLFVGSVSMEE